MRLPAWLVLLGVCGCDVPTELPRWDPTFAVPLEGTSISVAQLLPSSVTLTGSNAFALVIAPITFSTSLAQLCVPCAALNGQVVPKPAFTGSFSSVLTLPPDVVGGTLLSGWLRFTATNGFSFDPLRPGGAQTGSLTVRLVANGQALGSQTILGAQRAWPPGSALVDSIPLSGSGTAFSVDVIIDSPAGDPAPINGGATIAVTATPVQLLLSSAVLRVQNRQVAGQPVQLNLAGIDDFIIDRVQGGKLVLTLTNTFGVGGTLTLNVAGALTQITKQVSIAASNATVDVRFTEAELESMLGQLVTVSFSGLVSSASPVTITPASTFAVAVLLVLELGSS